jgi:hypothetical protein
MVLRDQTTNLTLKILSDKLQGVEECMDSGQLYLLRGFVLSCTVNDGGENFIGT